MDHNEIIQNNTQKLTNSSQKIKEIEKIANETEKISLSAVVKIKEQGEVLNNIHASIIEINKETDISTKQLRYIQKESNKFKLILLYIILLLIVLIVFVYRIKK